MSCKTNSYLKLVVILCVRAMLFHQYTNHYKLVLFRVGMNERDRMKMAAIAGASHALKLKSANFRASDADVLREVTESVEDILRKMNDEDED